MSNTKHSLQQIVYAVNPDKSIEDALTRLQKIGITPENMFVATSAWHGSTPALSILNRERSDVLWAFMERFDIDAASVLVHNLNNIPQSLLSLAARHGYTKFIQEWISKKLPIQPAEPGSPLLHAICGNKPESISILSDAGADWNAVHSCTAMIWSKNANKNPTQVYTEFITTPSALGVSCLNSKIVSLACKHGSISTSTWHQLIPNPLAFFSATSSDKPIIHLDELLPKLFYLHSIYEASKSSRYGHVYSLPWWQAWKKLGLIDEFKKTPNGLAIDWPSVINENNKTIPPHVFQAIADKSDKVITKDTLEHCLFLLNNRYAPAGMLKTSLTKERMQALWQPHGLLGAKPLNAISTGTSTVSSFLITSAPSVSLYGLTIFQHFKHSTYWKSGAEHRDFADQFWNTLNLAHRPDVGLSIPQAFKNPDKSLFSTLDTLSKNASPKNVLTTLNILATKTNTPKGTLNNNVKPVISPFKYLQFQGILEWGMENKLLDPNIVYSAFQEMRRDGVFSSREVQSSLPSLYEFESRVERRLLCITQTRISTQKTSSLAL